MESKGETPVQNTKSGQDAAQNDNQSAAERARQVEADNTADSNTRAERPSNLQKDPDEWKTGNESMTDAQRSYLKTLSDEAGESLDDNLSKAEASKRIDELQHKTGRGVSR
jgi:hypothetical protein